MALLLVLVIVLPIVLLAVGVLCGVGLDRLLPRWIAALRGPRDDGTPQPPSAPAPASSSVGVKASDQCQLRTIHVVASCATPPTAALAVPTVSQQEQQLMQVTPSPPRPLLPPAIALPDYSEGDSLQPSPVTSPMSYHQRKGSMEVGRLMRAGTSVLSQVMDELDTRSAIMRLMSDGVQMLPSPQVQGPSIFNPTASIMPPGEVHMDEIDLLSAIGKGGYGAVYKASWRRAPVAVKYIVCRTDDHDSLGRAIREVVLSKKMSHPNVVQCYSWTVLTQPEEAQEPSRVVPPATTAAATAAARRSLDYSFQQQQREREQQLLGPPVLQQALHRITEQPFGEEFSEAAVSPLPPSPFADAASQQQPCEAAGAAAEAVPPEVEAMAVEPSLPVCISSKQSTDGSGSVKSRAEAPFANSSPVIAAVRPADLTALASEGEGPLQAAELCSQQRGQQQEGPVVEDAETPAAGRAEGGSNNSFEEVLTRLAIEMQGLSRSVSIKLCHQSTGSSSFSDVHHGGFMLDGSRAASAPDSELQSRQLSPGSSLAGTPCAAAADSSNNPFKRSRLSRNTSMGAAHVDGASEPPGKALLDYAQAAGQAACASAEGDACSSPLVCILPAEAAAELASRPSAAAELSGTAPSAEVRGLASLPLPQLALPRLRTSSSSSSSCSGEPRQPLYPLSCEPAVPAMQSGSSSEQSQQPPCEPVMSALHSSSSQEGVSASARSSGLHCPSSMSLAAWQQQRSSTSGQDLGGPSRAESRGGSPPSKFSLAERVPAILSSSFQLWRSSGSGTPTASQSVQPRVPSRLGQGLRSNNSMDVQWGQDQGAPPSAPDTARLSTLPPGSPNRGPLGLRAGSYPSLAALQDEPLGRQLQTPKGSPGAGGRGATSPLPQELLGASRESSRGGRKQRRVDEVIEGDLGIDSRTDSFNSEEGFGSPVRNRCGGVKSVFELEGLHLTAQEALMVVVMEYCDLGALRKALKRRAFVPRGKWTFQTTYRALLRTAQEIAKGMEYIHDFDIVHGDLKPGNVLLKTHKVDRRGYIAKVSDFGLSRPITLGETHISVGSAMGTIAYTAPEIFSNNIAKKPSDVYSFGIMLWEMFYCKDLYVDLLDGQICMGVCDGTLRPEFDDACPLPYRRLAERCWHHDPEQRPTFQEIVKELVQIEVDFRNLTHRQNNRGVSGSGQGSAANSRPASPEVMLRSKNRGDFVRALQ